MGLFSKKEKQPTIYEIVASKNASLFTCGNHVSGLPIAENVKCNIFSCPEHYEISVNGNSFTLSKSKVIDVAIKTDVEISKQMVSSVGGAVAGAVVFGPLGAIIGGRAKEKKSKTISNYLIFTYKSDDEIKYIGFDASFSVAMAKEFVKEFQKNNTGSGTVIDL